MPPWGERVELPSFYIDSNGTAMSELQRRQAYKYAMLNARPSNKIPVGEGDLVESPYSPHKSKIVKKFRVKDKHIAICTVYRVLDPGKKRSYFMREYSEEDNTVSSGELDFRIESKIYDSPERCVKEARRILGRG